MTTTAHLDSRLAPSPKRVPRLAGALPLFGHLLELRRRPIELMQRVRDECGEIGEIRVGRHPLVLLFGEEAHEEFFRAPEEQLDQAAAYPFMKPIFGAGVVFDSMNAEQRRQAMKNQALRDQYMRGHAEVIARETERMIEGWGEAGEIDLLDFFAELTIYTSSSCLIGKEFRDELGPEYVGLFHELERGTDWLAYVNPYLPIPSFRRRDRARRRLVERMQAIIDRRKRENSETRDLVSVLMALENADGSPRYTADHIAGMFISLMFAGHHTTSGTAAWTLIEILRNPSLMTTVVDELDALYADGREVSYQALREIPELECALKEALRLHPPLIMLSRIVKQEFRYKGWAVEPGKTLAASPAISNRMPEHFERPEVFDPGRYKRDPAADRRVFAWIPFGAGRHRCVGAAFAFIQLKAIFSVLLRRYRFELAQPADSYRNDVSKMVIQLEQPCRVRYRRRAAQELAAGATQVHSSAAAAGGRRIEVDRELCQGHGVCVSEAPELFEIDPEQLKVRLRRTDVPEELSAKAAKAVRYCPTAALKLTEE